MSEKVMSESEKKKEDWMNSKWRPMMGWMYMAVCMADFVLFPVLWSLVQTIHGGSVQTQWSPITLQGAGLFHMAMGAILGIAAFGRTQEKMAGANNGGISAAPVGGGFSPVASSQPRSFAMSQPSSFAPEQQSQPFAAAPAVAFSSTGKAMPEQPPLPVI
jgi:hypothetical protein